MYSFFSMFDRFFYKGQMVVYIFFQDTDELRNIPDCQGIVFKFIDNFLPYGLVPFIGHSIYPEHSFNCDYFRTSLLCGVLDNLIFVGSCNVQHEEPPTARCCYLAYVSVPGPYVLRYNGGPRL